MFKYVTQNGVTLSQPSVCVSYTSTTGIPGYILNVYRVYDELTNDFGGKGRIKYLDASGFWFDSITVCNAFGCFGNFFISTICIH